MRQSQLSETEPTYDLLDILRVIKGVWRWAVLVPVLSAGIVGIWANVISEDAGLPFRSQAIVRFPTAAFYAGEVERLIQPRRPGSSAEPISGVLVDELPSSTAPSYRTIRLTLDSASIAAGEAALDSSIQQLAQGVRAFDVQNQLVTHDIEGKLGLLEGYLAAVSDGPSAENNSDEIIAKANTAALLVSALENLNVQLQQVRKQGSGPLVLVSQAETLPYATGLRWVRLPIAAAIGGLLAVLFFAFTQDGIRHAIARRRSRA